MTAILSKIKLEKDILADRGKVEDGGQVEEGDELPDEVGRFPELVLCSHLCRGTTTE